MERKNAAIHYSQLSVHIPIITGNIQAVIIIVQWINFNKIDIIMYYINKCEVTAINKSVREGDYEWGWRKKKI